MTREKRRTGMAAVAAKMMGGKSGSGRGHDPRGAANAVHRILKSSGVPMNGNTLTTHALGLGYWNSDAKFPVQGLTHSVNNSISAHSKIFVKNTPGQYELLPDAPPPLVPTDVDRPDELESGSYVYFIRANMLKALPGVTLPEVTATPLAIAEYMVGQTMAEAEAEDENAADETTEAIDRLRAMESKIDTVLNPEETEETPEETPAKPKSAAKKK